VAKNLVQFVAKETEPLNIVVIGMGYVGIPCAALLADVGWRLAFPSPASSAAPFGFPPLAALPSLRSGQAGHAFGEAKQAGQAERSGWKIDCLNGGEQWFPGCRD